MTFSIVYEPGRIEGKYRNSVQGDLLLCFIEIHSSSYLARSQEQKESLRIITIRLTYLAQRFFCICSSCRLISGPALAWITISCQLFLLFLFALRISGSGPRSIYRIDDHPPLLIVTIANLSFELAQAHKGI